MVSVNAPDKDAAAAIAASLTAAAINTEFEKASLPPATVLETATVLEATQFNVNQTVTVEGEVSLLMGPGVGRIQASEFLFFLRGTEANLKAVPSYRVPISRLPTVGEPGACTKSIVVMPLYYS